MTIKIVIRKEKLMLIMLNSNKIELPKLPRLTGTSYLSKKILTPQYT